jgi:hypothetical protein
LVGSKFEMLHFQLPLWLCGGTMECLCKYVCVNIICDTWRWVESFWRRKNVLQMPSIVFCKSYWRVKFLIWRIVFGVQEKDIETTLKSKVIGARKPFRRRGWTQALHSQRGGGGDVGWQWTYVGSTVARWTMFWPPHSSVHRWTNVYVCRGSLWMRRWKLPVAVLIMQIPEFMACWANWVVSILILSWPHNMCVRGSFCAILKLRMYTRHNRHFGWQEYIIRA